MPKPKFIMVHHSAVSYDKNGDQFKANNNYHKEKWNFKSSLGFYLAYNYEIAKSGLVRQARQDGEQTVACYQSNMNSGRCIHICLDGNFDLEKPMPAQIYALRDLLKRLTQKYLIPGGNIVFHNQYAKKTCPGKNVDLVFVRSLIVLKK
jgi:hypothetical protein